MLRFFDKVFRLVLTIIVITKGSFGQTPRNIPSSYLAGLKVNYIRTWDASKAGLTESTITSQLAKDVKIATQYFDGLGRPLQTVVKGGSLETSGGVQRDMVNTVVYDEFGRAQFQYLPFVSTSYNGNFKLDPFGEQKNFYNTQLAGQTGETNIGGNSLNWAYGQSVFEASPLNRVTESFAPGVNWMGTSSQTVDSNRRSIKTKYWVNTGSSADNVKIWKVTDVTGTFGAITNIGTYAAGELYKNVTVDEHNIQVIEFKDKEGKVILKKVQLTSAADDGNGRGHDGWLCTYYVYDDFNNLRCVIQPLAVDWLRSNNFSFSSDTTVLNELCFRYEYDKRNRMIRKKVPGAGEVRMIYDARDRLVMTQDANMRTQQKWLFTQYDELNRPISTGLLTDTSHYNDYDYHYNLANNSISYPTISAYPHEVLTRTFYDNYDWRATFGNPLSATFDNSYNAHLLTSYSVWPYPESPTQSVNTRGLVTGSMVRMIGTYCDLERYSVNIYDEKGRLIQVQTQNYLGNTNVMTNQYCFNGLPAVTVRKTDIYVESDTVVTKPIYDDLFRVVAIKKYVGGRIKWSPSSQEFKFTMAEKEIVRMEYDALGQLKRKVLAPESNGGAGLETQEFEYNIKGWLLGMNRDFLSGSGSKYFGFELGYDKLDNLAGRNFGQAQYNGNINGMIWKSTGDDVLRKYDFGYDAVNRFMKGAFEQKDGATWGSSVMNYTVKMGNGIDPATAYDFNGNIKSMTQFGWKPSGSQRIDSLTYTYNSLLSNKLKSVVDSNNDSLTKLGDFKYNPSTKTSTDYYYDLNGNLIQDKNKQITTIGYNYLNLVQYVGLNRNGENQYVYYTYDAAGNKVEKWAGEVEQELSTFTNYIGANVYERKSSSGSSEPLRLLFMNDDEGRIRFIPQYTEYQGITGGSLAYDYFVKDHLGNVRMVLTDELKTDAYPNLSFENDDPSTQSINELDVQNQYWNNSNGYSIDVVNVRYARPSAMGDTTANGDYVRRLRRSTGAIGATKLLKVMAGDRIHTKIEYYYGTTNSATNNAGADPLNSFVTSLISSFTYSDQVGGLIKNDAQTFTNQLSSNSSFLSAINPSPNSSGSNEAPKAYLNVLFFDEQFKFDSASSRIIKVAYGPGAKRTIDQTFSNAITAGKSGYVFVYFSNESETFVYIDNFQLSHERGSLLEETHYYPFGLTMAGISSNASAFGEPNSKFKYNGKEVQRQEFSDGSGLEWLDYGARMFDQQIGRWHVTDSHSETYYGLTQYNYCGNNPVNAVDIDGNLFIFANGFMLHHWNNQTIGENGLQGMPPGLQDTWETSYNPDRGFYSDGPKNNGQTFSYWDGVDDAYMAAYRDKNVFYTNGSFTPLSSAEARFNEGIKAGQELIRKLESGEITLAEGETIKIVGHSQGAAYAGGIASALAGDSRYGGLIEFVDYLSPHQPGDFNHPSLIPGRQFSTKSDKVSSKGWKAWLFGRSKYEKIEGTEWGVERESHKGGHAGHLVDTWLDDLIKYWQSIGITVNVKE